MSKDSFIFYRSFFEAISQLPKEERLQVYDSICELGLNQNEFELQGIPKAIFTLIKPQLEANNRRYKNGSKGGRPKTETKPKHNLNESKSKANKNDNDNVNVNVNVNKNDKRKFTKPTLQEILIYCNLNAYNVDPENFFNFYESNGWKVGKNPMKDWQACIRTWIKREKSDMGKSQVEKKDNIKSNDDVFRNYLNKQEG